MPNLNGTGPEGNGPQTGRKRGNCRKKGSPENESIEKEDAFMGRGRGRRQNRFGMGFGFGRNRRGFGFGRSKVPNSKNINKSSESTNKKEDQ